VAPPRPAILSDGRVYVLYELMLSNASNIHFTIDKLEAVDGKPGGGRIAIFDKKAIEGHSKFPGASGPGASLDPGQSGFVRINLSFPSVEEVPRIIGHVLTVSSEKPWGPYPTSTIVERVASIAVPPDTGPVIGPPLKGKGWITCAVGENWYHRTTVMPLNGKWFAPERWAVDYVQVDGKNRLRSGPLLELESYPQYGREIIAVADGKVLEARNDQPDQVPGKIPQGLAFEDACGNFVLLDIGGGYAAVYAHMIPGSVRVSVGDKVKRGQVLGLLGNSGNTDAPHLHFHIVEGTTPLASNGVPYVIESFEVKGRSIDSDYLEAMLKSGEPIEVRPADDAEKHARQMPADVTLVDFPQ